jgi:hypothetical protein
MKVFLVLALCSISAFIVVLRMRPDLVPLTSFTAPVATANPAPSPAPEKEKKKTGSGSASARTPRSARPVDPPTEFEAPYQGQRPQSTSTRPVVNPPARHLAQATVTAETLPVYATNSASSRILKVLNKGDQIQTDLAVIDSQGQWSLVRIPGQRISGYVHTEDIDLRRIQAED